MIKYYKLVGTEPVVVADLLEWAKWMEAHSQVAETLIEDPDLGESLRVSTIFLGVDACESLRGGAPPLLFETMAFAPPQETTTWTGKPFLALESLGYQLRYPTLQAAMEGHEAICKDVRRRQKERRAIITNALQHAKEGKP